MKKFLNGIASTALFVVSLFFAYVVVYLVRSEVVPALAKGTFTVETNSMILGRVWEGNEIYLLIAAYTLLGIVFAYGGIRFARSALPRRHEVTASDGK